MVLWNKQWWLLTIDKNKSLSACLLQQLNHVCRQTVGEHRRCGVITGTKWCDNLKFAMNSNVDLSWHSNVGLTGALVTLKLHCFFLIYRFQRTDSNSNHIRLAQHLRYNTISKRLKINSVTSWSDQFHLILDQLQCDLSLELNGINPVSLRLGWRPAALLSQWCIKGNFAHHLDGPGCQGCNLYLQKNI